jgi:hypothetical protein
MQTLDLLSIGIGLLFGTLLPRIIHFVQRTFTIPRFASKLDGIAAQMHLQWALDAKPPKKNLKFRDLRTPLPKPSLKTISLNNKKAAVTAHLPNTLSQNRFRSPSIAPCPNLQNGYDEAKRRTLLYRLQTLNSRLCDEDILTNPPAYHQIVELIASLQKSLNVLQNTRKNQSTPRGIIL